MRQSLLFFTVLSLVSSFKIPLESVKESELTWTMPLQTKFNCPKGFKRGQVRDAKLTANNYFSSLREHPYSIVFVTADWCDYCCQQEEQLLLLKEELSSRFIDGEEIKFFEINISTDMDVLKENKILFWKIPSIYFVRNLEYTQYGSFINYQSMLRWMNALLHPVAELHTIAEVESFLDSNQEVKEKTPFLHGFDMNIPSEDDFDVKIRMVGFFSDAEEYSGELELFHKYANQISHRYDLRVGLVTDKEIIKYFKDVKEGEWFNQHSWNTIVISRNNSYWQLDLSLLNEQQEEFMVYNSVSYIDEFSGNNNKLVANIRTPLVFFFIDTVFLKEAFHSNLKMLQQTALKFQGYYICLYMDGNTRTDTKVKFGLQKDAPHPTMIINYIYNDKVRQFPYEREYSEKNIFGFLKENLGTGANDVDELREKLEKASSDKILKYIGKTVKSTSKTIEKLVETTKYDTLLMVVDSDYDTVSEEFGKRMEKVVERLQALGIKSVVPVSYDLNMEGRKRVRSTLLEKGQLFLFSKGKMVKYTGKLTVLRVLTWIEANVEFKFALPEVPHLPVQHHEEYYRRLAVVEEYEENAEKEELELDDLVAMDFYSGEKDEL